ncbi:hypothetical protein LINPERHAP1_LOCUS31748 [Linum perenne]
MAIVTVSFTVINFQTVVTSFFLAAVGFVYSQRQYSFRSLDHINLNLDDPVDDDADEDENFPKGQLFGVYYPE